ncbi:MAG: type II/IV secretion system protein [Armatimonadetes bacterium]|nr:type II/IV secretion system protein [Armatimonadota bacterium]
MANATFSSVIVREGLLSHDQLDSALAGRTDAGEDIGRYLVRRGLISEADRVRCLALQNNVQFVDIADRDLDPAIARLISHSVALRYKAIPIEQRAGTITVAMANPLDVAAVDEIAISTALEPIPVIAVEEDIMEAIFRCFGAADDVSDIIGEAIRDVDTDVKLTEEDEAEADQGIDIKELAEGAPVVRLVNALISRAISSRASDIHVEPEAGRVRVRLRVDGILHETMVIPKDLQSAVISRIKVMANMDIAERRTPQDGRLTLMAPGQQYDFRISTYPAVYGENVVIRVLEKSAARINFSKLGLLPAVEDQFSRLTLAPYGMILTCGPTGSGKTTTLYAALNSINSVERNILTIEDPVEYQLPGVIQANVNRKAGLTFSVGLRTIVRQDPDVILVGEIRDAETAEIAVEAALTGHLVLSTIHANDSTGALTRLVDMDIEPFLVASSVLGVMAQRLVRTICNKCMCPYAPGEELLSRLGLNLTREQMAVLKRGAGCEQCAGTGYRGRIGVYELLKTDDDIRTAVVARRPSADIRAIAVEKGMQTLREDALHKALEGLTTIEEVVRVTSD